MTDCPSAIVNPNATVFYLWTALGAAKFAKSLKSRRAWQVYESLSLHYFSDKKIADKKSDSSNNALTAEKKIKFLLQAVKITKDAVRREKLIALAENIIVG